MFAVTERLLLRPGFPEDAPALMKAIGHPTVVRSLTRVPWPYCMGDAEAFLAAPRSPDRPFFLICRREDAVLIGGIALTDEEPQLGYWFAPDQWGRGYATEAGRAVMAIADESLRLPRVISSHALDNPASGHVLRKLGFTPTGLVSRASSPGRGAELDMRHMQRERMGSIRSLAA
jgi:RimJ/RimL family protein N-acetyltransferase